MPQIKIPQRSFKTAARGYTRENYYHGVDACIYRELIQNSKDANATKIEFTLTEDEKFWILTCKDDGIGMSKEKLEKAMLTYSGTEKSQGSVGGFGMAKNLLVFAPDRCIIETLNTTVCVEGIEYEYIQTEEKVDGTEITIYCDKNETDPTLKLQPTEQGLTYFMQRSFFDDSCKVYFNGKEVKSNSLHLLPENEIKDFSFGKGFYFKGKEPFKNENGNVISVCIKGLWMFDMKVSEDANGLLVVNLEGDSVKILTDTRCSFAQYNHRSEIEKWIETIAQGAQSVLKPKRFVRRFAGNGLNSIFDTIEPIVKQELSEDNEMVFNSVIQKITCLDTKLITSERINNIQSISKNELTEIIQTLVWKPDLLLVNETDKDVNDKYFPATMGSKVKKLLTVWTEYCKQFLVWNRKRILFGVGILFSDDTAAQYRGFEDSDWFLINLVNDNGNLRFNLSNEYSRSEMVVSAAHEVSHALSGGNYHGDSFVKHYDKCLKLALDNQSVINMIWKNCR